jgi:hypothetical protein
MRPLGSSTITKEDGKNEKITTKEINNSERRALRSQSVRKDVSLAKLEFDGLFRFPLFFVC